jgi:hypothetical protein
VIQSNEENVFTTRISDPYLRVKTRGGINNMADESMQMPPDSGSDVIELGDEIPVHLDSLEVDGTRPAKGDEVTLKVTGTISRIEDNCAYVQPESINDSDLSEILAEHSPEGEDSMMAKLTSQADQANMAGGYG